jgi:hypothetical protein
MQLHEMVIQCAKRCRQDTTMRRAFLRAVGVDVPTKSVATIHVDESADIRECFANKRRVRL